MEWEPETKHKFERLQQFIPAYLRATAQKTLSRMAEEIAMASHREFVGDTDLIIALIKVTPAPSKALMISRCKEVGLPIEG